MLKNGKYITNTDPTSSRGARRQARPAAVSTLAPGQPFLALRHSQAPSCRFFRKDTLADENFWFHRTSKNDLKEKSRGSK
ncbi:hypothetical protein E2C01_043701 [Portunus trituberculatus]|uniref:Uncharacterized protein n=1 Tax=Portunus trituberculatus TaxID=210409 RepID=A0A5B7FWD8_PORTR|nr:hypothetical protein [Portunus trituberculatus]